MGQASACSLQCSIHHITVYILRQVTIEQAPPRRESFYRASMKIDRQLASRQQDPSARATNIIQIIALTSSDTDKAAIERSYRCAEHVERTALKQTRNAVEDKW